MAKCFQCHAETELHIAGLPVCIRCMEAVEKGYKPPARDESEDRKLEQTKAN